MELILLRQQAWQIRMRAHALQVRAKATTQAAQRQRLLAREQLECRRLRLMIPDARAFTIQIIARLLVARNLDAHAPKDKGPADAVGKGVARPYAGTGGSLRLRP